jgi:hypothetical protein
MRCRPAASSFAFGVAGPTCSLRCKQVPWRNITGTEHKEAKKVVVLGAFVEGPSIQEPTADSSSSSNNNNKTTRATP